MWRGRLRFAKRSALILLISLAAACAPINDSQLPESDPVVPNNPTNQINPINPSSPGIGQPIQTATEIAVGVNEFPLTALRANAPVIDAETQLAVITGRLSVQRHSSDPNTFDPLTLFFELIGADSGATLPTTTVLPRIHPSVSHAEVEFEMEVPLDAVAGLLQAYPDETGLLLIVHLGSQIAQTLVPFPAP